MSEVLLKQHALKEFELNFPNKIKKWVDASENRTVAVLIKLTGVRPQSVYDIADGKKSVLNLSTAKILKLLCTLDGKSEAEIANFYRFIFKQNEKNGSDSVESLLDTELSNDVVFTKMFVDTMKNPIAFEIYTNSVGLEGVSEKFVAQKYGEYGTQILSQLRDKKILINTGVGTNNFPINRNFLSLDRKDVKELIPVLNSFYNPNNAFKERNYNFMRTEKVNRDTLRKIQEVFANAHNTVETMLSTNASKGDIAIYCFGQLDTFQDEI